MVLRIFTRLYLAGKGGFYRSSPKLRYVSCNKVSNVDLYNASPSVSDEPVGQSKGIRFLTAFFVSVLHISRELKRRKKSV